MEVGLSWGTGGQEGTISNVLYQRQRNTKGGRSTISINGADWRRSGLTRPRHRWELLGNCHDLIVVMVFYLFCWITKRIIVTAITGFKIYILIQSLMLFI